ncbi:homoprotocatechuate degradation operon regulator HpaR [Shigella sonnei]|nr:homoprotocatechuate degradation operon regulator HpaR [Shigella sonnei]EGD9474431.1 homoprotocatechuate degradation operon regulator HpaR [Shigella sonnei]EGE4445460.1 homoprotocatechuate degradation operon regulator HpaR [Shigella sonnei]
MTINCFYINDFEFFRGKIMHDSLTIALLQAREAAMSYFRPIVKRHNLTEQQWRIVRILAESPSMDFHDLAYRACILRPSLTGILTRMERDGLVLRLKPINDQWKLYISLTKEGQALYNRAQTQIEEAYRQIEAQFTAEKMQQLTHLLEEFIALGNSRQEAIPGDNE